MNVSIRFKKEEVISLTNEEITQITIKKLNNILCPQEADSFFIKDGNLMRRDDYGHHRGGIIEEIIRPATELDKAIIKVLNKLSKE